MSCFIYVFSFFVQIKGVFLTFKNNMAHLIDTTLMNTFYALLM